MNTHPYVRAYMTGITVPALFLLLALVIFSIFRYAGEIPVPLERLIVFPMALVPNAWGAWNMLYVAVQRRRRYSVGLHGAILPLLLLPLGMMILYLLAVPVTTHVVHSVMLGAPVIMATYYLAWKYLVGWLNELLGIA